MSDIRPLIARAEGEGLVIPFGSSRVIYKVLTAESRGQYELFEFAMPAGGTAPEIHIHRAMDEMFYVLEGEAAFVVGDRQAKGPAGSVFFIPRDNWHGVSNGSDRPCRVLVTFSPANNMHEYFGQFSKMLSGGRIDPEALRALTMNYDSVRLNDEKLVKNA